MRNVTDLLESVPSTTTVLSTATREYDGGRFLETVYKTGNYLRFGGVHQGAVVEIVPVTAPETIFTILGTTLLEGRMTFASVGIEDRPAGGEPAGRETSAARTDVAGRVDTGVTDGPTVLVGPTATIENAPIPAGCTAIGYGESPTDPAIAYFEREVWSENPVFPETDPNPNLPLLGSGGGTTDFATILDRASAVGEELSPRDRVAVRAPIHMIGTIAAGLFAPLVSHASIVLPDGTETGTVAVSTGTAPEERVIDPASVFPG